MSILLDNRGYLGLRQPLRKYCEQFEIDLEVKDLNGKGWGDLVIFGLDGIYSVEIKQAGEYLGSPDHLIAQLKAQIPNADYSYVFIYDTQELAPDGNSYSFKLDSEKVDWMKDSDSGVTRRYRRRYHRVNHVAQRKILWRFRQEGIQVVECRSLDELAYELCLLHEVATTVGTTFSRLIPEKFRIGQYPPEKTNFMLSIMGLMPKWGGAEEIAEAVASCLEELKFPLTIQGLFYLWNSDEFDWRDDYRTTICSAIERQPLRNSLREGARRKTVGPAAVAKLKAALGV